MPCHAHRCTFILPLSLCLAGNNRVNEFVRNRCVIPFHSIQSPVPSIVFGKGLPHLSPLPPPLYFRIFVRPQDAIVWAAFPVASQKLKSKTVYGVGRGSCLRIRFFGYFMQISSITFQSIRQTVAEGSLDGMRKGSPLSPSFVPLAARQFSFRALSIYFTLSRPAPSLEVIYPFAACHNLQHPQYHVQFWLFSP